VILGLVLALLGAGLLCIAYGVAIERRWYRLRHERLAILPANGPEALTVLHLSDMHFVAGDARKAAFIARLPAADVTIVTGDFLGEPQAVERTVEALRPVRGRLASWFVLGSNDYYAPKPLNYAKYFTRYKRKRMARRGRAPELVAQLERDGWVRLDNTRREIDLDGLAVELLGLDDAHIQLHDLRVAPRRAPERFGWAVMHSPDSLPEAIALGYRFSNVGHTHGGQVRLPIVGALVTNSDMPNRLAGGLLRFGDAFAHTSRGLGTSKYAPFRFFCRPEATLLELRRRPQLADAAAVGGGERRDRAQEAASTSENTRS
jgi:uncharacterized protein